MVRGEDDNCSNDIHANHTLQSLGHLSPINNETKAQPAKQIGPMTTHNHECLKPPMEQQRVGFAPTPIKGPSLRTNCQAPAALRVANQLLDKFSDNCTNNCPDEGAIDLAATGQFMPDACRGCDHQPASAEDAATVKCANETEMFSTSTDTLDIDKLAAHKGAAECNEFKNMSASLSLVQKMDTKARLSTLFRNCEVTAFESEHEEIEVPGKVIMKGKLKTNGLHMVPSHDQIKCPTFDNVGSPTNQHTMHRANALQPRTMPALIEFCHCALGCPPIQSWSKAINEGWFASWPGLTAARVRKHCVNEPQTTSSHMHLQRQGIDSTKTQMIASMLVLMINQRQTVTTTPQTLVPSTILLRLIQWMICRISLPWMSQDAKLTKRGFTAELVRLDNEVSTEPIKTTEDDNLDHQIVSPGDHQNNPAEPAFKHAKAAFKSVRACTDQAFDARDWDLLSSHTELTMNSLRPSKINPLVSACTMINGQCNFCKHPSAPAGTKVMVHEQHTEQGTWSDCGIEGFFIEPAMHHCRNTRRLIPGTNAI